MLLKLDLFFSFQFPFLPFRNRKLEYKLWNGVTLRKEVRDYSLYLHTSNVRPTGIHCYTMGTVLRATAGSQGHKHRTRLPEAKQPIWLLRQRQGKATWLRYTWLGPTWVYLSRMPEASQRCTVRTGSVTHKPLPVRETTTHLFTPKGLAFEQSDYYPSLNKKGSSNKKVNKKFIKFFKSWYFNMAPIRHKQVQEDHHCSLLVLPSCNLQNDKLKSLLVEGLTFKSALDRGGLPTVANTKLYLLHTLRGEWLLLKKVTDLENYLTAFLNQGKTPVVNLSDKKVDVAQPGGLETKTTNLNSILSFWSLSFVALIIRLKWNNPDLNLFLAHYPFEVSSVVCMTVPQNSNMTLKGVEVSKIKAVLLSPKTGNPRFIPLSVPTYGTTLVVAPVPHLLQNQGKHTSMGSELGREVKQVMYGHLQHILLTAKVKQNNQIEPNWHPLVPNVGTLAHYTKGIKFTFNPLGIKKGRLDQYYSSTFSRLSATPYYLTMLNKVSMPNHQYSKKISQQEYLIFKKSQGDSLFFKSPSVMSLRSNLVPNLLTSNSRDFTTSEGINTNPSNITQTTKMYIKASYLLSNFIKAQAFNNSCFFSYLPPVTKITLNLKAHSSAKTNLLKKRVALIKKSKMSIRDISVYNFIAKGLATNIVPNVVVEKKEGLSLVKSTKDIIRLHEARLSLVSNSHPVELNGRGPTKFIDSLPDLLFTRGDDNVINSVVLPEKNSLCLVERVKNQTNVFTPTYGKDNSLLGSDRFAKRLQGVKSENLKRLGVRALFSSTGDWSNFKLDSVKSHQESNLLPPTSYIEDLLLASNPSDHSRNSGNHMLSFVKQGSMGSESGLRVKSSGGVSTATTFKIHKQAPLVQPTYSKGLLDDTVNVLLFKVAHFFQTLFWDINIYNVLWLKTLILKNADLTFKNRLYDKDYSGSLPPLPLNTLLLTPRYESYQKLVQVKGGWHNYAKTGSFGIISAKIEKNPLWQYNPHKFAEYIKFVEGKKTGNTKLLRSFMLLMNHKKFQAKKKLTPFSMNLELSFKEALSSKVGKRLSTVYEMRKLEKQEYRAQKENIEAMSNRPKKRKRFYPRPDWLRVRLYETLLTPPYCQPDFTSTIKPNKVVVTKSLQTGVVRQEKNVSPFKKLKGDFREKRSMPFYFRTSKSLGTLGRRGSKNSLLLSSDTCKGVILPPVALSDRGTLISRFSANSKALFKFNPLENNISLLKKVVGTTSLVSSDSPNILNNNSFRVWFFNTFYNFDCCHFLEVNNLSMLRIFWSLNQTNVCSISSFRDTKPNPEIWLNTFGQWAPLDAKKKAERTYSVFKGFTPFASNIRKMSPTQIKARFASSKTPANLLASSPTPTPTLAQLGTAKEVNPSFSWKSWYVLSAIKENNNENKDNTTSWHKGMQTYATKSPNLTGRLSSFFHDPMLPPLKQGDQKQAQKKKRRKQVDDNSLPHIEENPGFKNRDHVWCNQKDRERAENNKTKFLIRELSMKISNLTHAFPYKRSHYLSNQYNNAKLLALPTPFSTWLSSDSKFNLTKYRQKQQKLNYLGVIPYSFQQPKRLNINSRSRMQSAYGKTPIFIFNMTWKPSSHFKYKNSVFEKKRLSPFYTSSGLMKEYALGTKKQTVEKKTTSKFWWLKNANFKPLYAQHRVSNSGKTGTSNSTNYKGLPTYTTSSLSGNSSWVTSPTSNLTESPVAHAMQKGWENPCLGTRLLTSTSLLLASPFPSLPLLASPSKVGQEGLSQVPAALPRVEETILISLFSMATTVFFHFCCLIGLLSISQVRCAIKFYFILFYKLSNSYVQLISSLYRWTFQYPLSFLRSQKQHSLNHYYPGFSTLAQLGKVNAFLKYSKPLVLTRACSTKSSITTLAQLSNGDSRIIGYPPTRPTSGTAAGLRDSETSAVLPASYPQIGKSMSNLLRFRLRSGYTFGNMKNSPNVYPTRVNILVWLNQRAVAKIFSWADKEKSGVPGCARELKGKKVNKLLPDFTSLESTPKAKLALFNKFFVLFLPTINKHSFQLSAASIKEKQLSRLQLQLSNANKSLSFIRMNAIKTTMALLEESRFLLIRSLALLVFFIQDCFQMILRFFENPTELSLDFFAYAFLVELYSDSLSIMPEIIDLTSWNWFQKTTGSLKTSLFFGNLLQRRFFCFFYILLNTLNQPDAALIRQQVKGTLFWDLWADLLIKTVTSENQLDVSSLARFEQERTSLVDSLLFETGVGPLASLTDFLLPFWDNGGASLSNSIIGSKVKDGATESYNTKFLHLTQIKHNFLHSDKLPMSCSNPLEISADSPDSEYVVPTPYRVNKESKTEKKWGANQHVSYQQIDTDLFVDLNVSKSFSHVSGIKYYAGVQSPVGSLVCQIYTGLFETQAAKNVLVIGPASTCTKTFDSKSLLIQALAGETEIKIILDTAARYTLVNRGLAVGIRLLKEVFNAIALQTPCFYLLEDVHLIGEKRLLLINDSSDAKKILNNKMPLSHIDSLEVHEKNQVMIQFSKQAVTHYKKPYRDSAEQSIATSQYCFDFFLGNKKRGKRVKGMSLPSPIPIVSLTLNSVSKSNSTKHKLKLKKSLNEISFEENSKEPEFILVPRINYSVRLKVALLAQHTLSNFSAKVDMITDLLVIIDNVRSNRGFIVFATTNRAHRLDPALRRPGRLDETIRVPFLPTASARWEILKSNLGLFFKSTFSPFHVKRTVCLDLIEFTHLSIQVNSSLIMPSLPPIKPVVPLSLHNKVGTPAVRNNRSKALFIPTLPILVRHKYDWCQVHNKVESLTAILKSPSGVGYFTTPKKSKLYLLGNINFERVKIMAYCKVAKKLILNSTVAMGSSIMSSIPTHAVAPLPSVYAKGHTLYWNSIALQEKTFITPEHKNLPLAVAGTTPLQLPELSGGGQNAKYALPFDPLDPLKRVKMSTSLLLNTLDLEKSHDQWEIPQDTTDIALSIPMVKRKLLNLFASKVAESFVCQLFRVNQLATVERQSVVGGLGRKSVGFFNTLNLPGDRTCNDWKKASSLVKSFLQKRYMYNKNTIVNSLLCVANGSFVGEFKDESTNPPHSVILSPSKRYENYKKIFDKHKKKVSIKFTEKVQLHEQQKFVRNLYTSKISKSDGHIQIRPNTPVEIQNGPPYLATLDEVRVNDSQMLEATTVIAPLPPLPQQQHTNRGSGKDMKWGQNLQGNAGQTFRPGLAITDSNAKENNINNSIEGNYSKLSSVSWYYNASIVKRHQFYLTNQWFNGQLAEHNAETVFLSDVDWRLTFIEELGDLSIDFPDADQLYNPRHRRWLLNTSSLSGGTASSWHTFYNYEQEISDHLVMQAFNKIYVLLDKNRQQLDALSYKLIKTGFLKEMHFVKLAI